MLALRADPPAIVLDSADRAAVAGRYALAPDRMVVIAATAEGLTISEAGRPAKPLCAESRDVFFIPGAPRYRYLIERDAAGRILAVVQRREAWDLRWRREA